MFLTGANNLDAERRLFVPSHLLGGGGQGIYQAVSLTQLIYFNSFTRDEMLLILPGWYSLAPLHGLLPLQRMERVAPRCVPSPDEWLFIGLP